VLFIKIIPIGLRTFTLLLRTQLNDPIELLASNSDMSGVEERAAATWR
jgi:hypothetical protein